MKDYLNKSAWVNKPVRNRTQTIYTRFITGPAGGLKSGFTANREAFDKFKENALKTRYTRMLEG